MKRVLQVILALALTVILAQAQGTKTATPASTPANPASQQTRQQAPQRTSAFDLSEVGVQIKPDARLIIVMAALDAAGFDPTPKGEEPSVFRAQLRRDQENLDPDLRKRLSAFYERHKLRGTNGKELSSAEQAAPYVSLAYALSPAPNLEEPPRSDDLPAALLDVLDFAPLVREFYRRSGIDERQPAYTRMYQAEGDRLRRPTAEMVGRVLAYLNTRPILT